MKKYISTVGLNAAVGNRLKLVRVAFTVSNTNVTARVENGYTLSPVKNLGKIVLTHDDFRNLPHDPYDDLVFTRAAFALFGLQV